MIQRVEAKVRQRRRRRQMAAGTIAALVVGAVLLVPWLRDTATISTQAGASRELELADGSRVRLNARTTLRTDFRYGRRHLRLLNGQAYFVVVRDASRPFAVETPNGTVRVIGTEFDVRLGADQRPEVTLLRGAIRFEAKGGVIALQPGQQIWTGRKDDGFEVRALSPEELASHTAWHEGKLVLDGLSLAEVAERLSAFHGSQIEVAPEVARLRPGGTVPLANLPSVLEVLRETLGVRVVPQGNGSYRLSGQESAGG